MGCTWGRPIFSQRGSGVAWEAIIRLTTGTAELVARREHADIIDHIGMAFRPTPTKTGRPPIRKHGWNW